MYRLCITFILLALCANAQNLLKNPSFETTTSNQPNDWSFFVQPKYDASSLLDQRVAQDGTNSVRLSIGTPYTEDPANNWSQNILADVRGKELQVRGYIKTENAAEAAIWLQCYRKRPLHVSLQQSSTATHLMTGTNDWTAVAFSLRVPEDADFVVVRCVLRGQGVAWFDSLAVEAQTPDSAAAALPPATAKPLELPEIKMPTPPTMPSITPPAAVAQDQAKALLQAHADMLKANEALQKSNNELTRQIVELRKQIDDLKKQVGDTATEAKRLKDEQRVPIQREQPVQVPAPPLVPGEVAEDAP